MWKQQRAAQIHSFSQTPCSIPPLCLPAIIPELVEVHKPRSRSLPRDLYATPYTSFPYTSSPSAAPRVAPHPSHPAECTNPSGRPRQQRRAPPLPCEQQIGKSVRSRLQSLHSVQATSTKQERHSETSYRRGRAFEYKRSVSLSGKTAQPTLLAITIWLRNNWR